MSEYMSIDQTKSFDHYGVKYRSGRYPYGSGENPYQHDPHGFMKEYSRLKSEGKTETEIAKAMQFQSTVQLRAMKSKSSNFIRAEQVAKAEELRAKGMSNSQIGRELGLNESTVRSLFDERSKAKMEAANKTAEFLKQRIEETDGYIDVGKGVAERLGISNEKLEVALETLRLEGYEILGRDIPQATNPGKQTVMKLLCKPGTQYREVFDSSDKITSVDDYISRENPKTGEEEFVKAFQYPASMDGKRLMVRYADDTDNYGVKGIEKDGTIELRRGVADLDLGGSNYAQVRILVNGTHYLKGMALYSDDLPEGVDVVFNTNKSNDVPVFGSKDNSVLKPIKHDDPMNPFGAAIKEHGGQHNYIDPKTGEEKLSLINKRSEEGDWDSWSNSVPSQFLSKQDPKLIESQLKLSIDNRASELDTIMSVSVPSVRRRLLVSFANSCDSTAEHLNADSFPRQKYQVILPVEGLKDTEVYAPNYRNGEKVALVRYPHAGTFEIPILTVNNNDPNGRRILGTNTKDAVGINASVAARLSGADFDGDTVMVIPTRNGANSPWINNRPLLKELEGFDPKMKYPYREGMKVLSKGRTQLEMGMISNLISDMDIKKATDDEMARAVRHSMVVIDAAKHRLDYKLSEAENNILELKQKYQLRIDEDGHEHMGASTIVSRAKSKVQVLKSQGSPKIDENGDLVYKRVEEHYKDSTGKDKIRMQDSTLMRETKDARTIAGDNLVEQLYANYANGVKDLARKARLAYMNTENWQRDPKATEKYSDVVESVKQEIAGIKADKPKERLAQTWAHNATVALRDKFESENEESSGKKKISKDQKESIKKLGNRVLKESRDKLGVKHHAITMTDRLWEAIVNHAFSETTLREIVEYSDLTDLKERATPRNSRGVPDWVETRIRTLKNLGYTNAQIADSVGFSASTVSKIVSE